MLIAMAGFGISLFMGVYGTLFPIFEQGGQSFFAGTESLFPR